VIECPQISHQEGNPEVWKRRSLSQGATWERPEALTSGECEEMCLVTVKWQMVSSLEVAQGRRQTERARERKRKRERERERERERLGFFFQ
jgi:hypothetical protein